jgi:hypothetical protein
MDKYFSLIVLCLGAPLAIGATIAMFINPCHIFTAAVLWAMIGAALTEQAEDGENLIAALRRVTCKRGGK